MLTNEQRELFQKDKYELVDIVVMLRNKLKNLGVEEQKPDVWTIPNSTNELQKQNKFYPPEGIIEKTLDKLNKEMDYGNKEEKTTNKNYNKTGTL